MITGLKCDDYKVKMLLDYTHKPGLELARKLALDGDYGAALHTATLVLSYATLSHADAAAIEAGELVSRIELLIEVEFRQYATAKGIKITPENRLELMLEHSPHYIRFNQLRANLKKLVERVYIEMTN